MLFVGAGEHWRAPFELIQATLAFDLPVELSFAGAGLELLRLMPDAEPSASARAFASLRLLGLGCVYAPLSEATAEAFSLPVRGLELEGWRTWLRAGSLQVC